MNVGSEICMYYLYIVVLWILYGTFAYFYQWLQELMGERDQVWEHGENLLPGFKCKCCIKEFHGGRATRLKEHLAEKVRILRGALNAYRTYGITSYVSCKGSESERRL
jgi:hypothetical protein